MRKNFILTLACMACAVVAAAQAPLFPTPNYFKQAFARPIRYSLELPGSLRDLLQDGRLRLSLADLVRLVVARNTEVWLARMDVQAAANNR